LKVLGGGGGHPVRKKAVYSRREDEKSQLDKKKGLSIANARVLGGALAGRIYIKKKTLIGKA